MESIKPAKIAEQPVTAARWFGQLLRWIFSLLSPSVSLTRCEIGIRAKRNGTVFQKLIVQQQVGLVGREKALADPATPP
jgi:hypothetical protein